MTELFAGSLIFGLPLTNPLRHGGVTRGFRSGPSTHDLPLRIKNPRLIGAPPKKQFVEPRPVNALGLDLRLHRGIVELNSAILGQNDAGAGMRELFDSRAAAAACIDLTYSRRKPRPPLPSPEELKAQREQAVREGYLYVKGRCGSTVFNFGWRS